MVRYLYSRSVNVMVRIGWNQPVMLIMSRDHCGPWGK